MAWNKNLGAGTLPTWSQNQTMTPELQLDVCFDFIPQTNWKPKVENGKERKVKELIPENQRDVNYWDLRRRNNQAAKRLRERRRFNRMGLERRFIRLTKENHILKAKLSAINEKFGIGDWGNVILQEEASSNINSNDDDQPLNLTQEPKICPGRDPTMMDLENGAWDLSNMSLVQLQYAEPEFANQGPGLSGSNDPNLYETVLENWKDYEGEHQFCHYEMGDNSRKYF